LFYQYTTRTLLFCRFCGRTLFTEMDLELGSLALHLSNQEDQDGTTTSEEESEDPCLHRFAPWCEEKEELKYCKYCQTELLRFCSKCGTKIRFCTVCAIDF
jgi:hypothetical protein